jgi:hypothetical protein
MHNNTHSVRKRILSMWRARLLCFEPFRYVYPPPLSEANCPPFPPPGGLGPPASKMAPFSPGSTHIPPTLSVTLTISLVFLGEVIARLKVEDNLYYSSPKCSGMTSYHSANMKSCSTRYKTGSPFCLLLWDHLTRF